MEIVKAYLVHLGPTVLVTLGLHFYDPSIPNVSLIRFGFLMLLLLLASRGLASIFPRENLATRSTAIMVEHALLIGALAGAFFVVAGAFVGTEDAGQDMAHMLKTFVIITVVVAAGNYVLAVREKRRLGTG